jgi:hypothetical protein
MIGRALAVWALIAVLATANGILRERVLVPAIGARYAQPLSVALLAAIILIAAAVTIHWISAAPVRDRWRIGAVWALLAIGFDLLLARLEHGRSVPAALRAMTPGQIIVFLVTFIAPAAAAALKGRTS